MRTNRCSAMLLVLALFVAGCASTSPVPSGASIVAAPVPVAEMGSTLRHALDLTALPLDDYRYTTSGPKAGWVYVCQAPRKSQPQGSLPWMDVGNNTWNYDAKIKVQGAVSWTPQMSITMRDGKRVIATNDLPDHVTGTFPIAASDPAYQYDRNPNSIQPQNLRFALPANPKVAARPSCVDGGPVGVMLTGAVMFDGLDAAGRDAAVHEVLDQCWGHPQMQGEYHYHTYSPCMGDSKSGHSKLLGYALDGFPIYGPRGQGGKMLTSSDLDACHGHTHLIEWNGKWVKMYHYHLTYDYPYSIACFRGTPLRVAPGP